MRKTIKYAFGKEIEIKDMDYYDTNGNFRKVRKKKTNTTIKKKKRK